MANRMPAEWEPHAATWIAWPHHEPDWPGKLEAIPWVYAEIVRALAPSEMVHVLCQDAAIQVQAQAALSAHGVAGDRYMLHVVPTDRAWLRDSAPTAVIRGDEVGAGRTPAESVRRISSCSLLVWLSGSTPSSRASVLTRLR